MESSNPLSLPPRELVRLIWSQRRVWIATTVVCGVLAAVSSLIMPRYWEAWQGLVVRQETAGASSSRPGKFADLYEMRTLQETILEIAKSQHVVTATLEAVNRAEGVAEPPTLEDIDEFRQRLKMLPPDGGEFGKTEVFYFTVRAKSRDRAIRLVGELCRQLERALRELRSQRAGSLIAEIDEQAELAAATLEGETQRLAEFETRVGSDLGELRMLHSANSGQSDLRMESVQLESDVRRFRTQVREGEKLIALLRAAQDDPQQLVATPNSLLTSQPALRRLKDGLIDAQLATSRLGGTRAGDHPRVRSAREAEQQIRADLHSELVAAIQGAEVEQQLSRDRLAATQERLDNLQNRFARLAELRAEYSNRVAAVENCRLTLDRVRQELSTARAAQAAAHSGSLVTRLDEPETGPHPAGPGRTVITGAGATAGLMMGLGLVFLFAPPVVSGPNDGATAPAGDGAPARLKSTETDGPPPQAASAFLETPPSAEADLQWWLTPPDPAAPLVPAGPGQSNPSPEGGPTDEPPHTATPERPAPAPRQAAAVALAAPEKASREPLRHRRDPLPKALPATSGVLPLAGGSLPTGANGGAFGGMSLQEALLAAARQSSN